LTDHDLARASCSARHDGGTIALANRIPALSIDAVEVAAAGHPGAPTGMAW